MPISIIDDSSSELAYSGSWSKTAGNWISNDGQRGTLSVTSQQGASVSFTFPVAATGFRIYGLKSSRGSYYGVCLDCDPSNPQYTFVSNYNATDDGTSPPVFFYHYSWATAGIHKVTLVNESDRRGIPAGTSVLSLDRFELDVPVGSPISDPASQSPSSAAPSSVTQTPTSQSANGGGGNANSPPVITTVVGQGGGVVTQVITQNVTGGAGGASTPATNPITTSPSAGAPNPASQTGLPSPSSASSGDKPVGASANDSGHSSKSTPLGAIIGGIVGGLAVIALVIFLFFWLKKRKKGTSPATGVTPLEVPEMRTTAPDLANSGQVSDYAEFRSEKGNRHHFEQSYSSYPSGSNPRTDPTASNAALLNPAPVSPSASTLSYVQSQHPSEPVSNENTPTREPRRVRELDAGPVPRDFQDEENVETLPPEYGQVFSNSNRLLGPVSRSEMDGMSTSGATAVTLRTNSSESSQPLQPLRRT